MATTSSQPAKQLSMLGFFAITASMVMAVYEYPTFATSGFSLVFFLLVAGIFWFIPVGLCAAEMATVESWNQGGGVFTWVGNTLGERWGFAAIFFVFLQISIGFIPMLYFVLGSLSYILNWPALNTDAGTKTIAALIILWVLAFTQFGGTKYTARLAKAGFFGGIAFPALVLVGLAILYISSGDHHVAIEMNASTFFPDFTKLGTLVVFVAFILSYMGAESSATHVNEMSNPGRNYPMAIILLLIVAIVLSSIGGLAVAAVIPHAEINLSAGIVQAYEVLMKTLFPKVEWFVRVLVALLVLGALAEIASWITGPSRGLLVTAQQGLLPQKLAKVNKGGVPVNLVILQLIITSIAIVVFTNMSGGGGNLSFLIAMALTVLLYLGSYFLLFIGHIAMVRKQKDLNHVFKIPGGTGMRLALPISGLTLSLVAFVVSFVPPALPGGHSTDSYFITLLVSYIIVASIPFIVYAIHNKKGKMTHVTLTPITTANAPEGHAMMNPRVRPTHLITVHDQPMPIEKAQAIEAAAATKDAPKVTS